MSELAQKELAADLEVGSYALERLPAQPWPPVELGQRAPLAVFLSGAAWMMRSWSSRKYR